MILFATTERSAIDWSEFALIIVIRLFESSQTCRRTASSRENLSSRSASFPGGGCPDQAFVLLPRLKQIHGLKSHHRLLDPELCEKHINGRRESSMIRRGDQRVCALRDSTFAATSAAVGGVHRTSVRSANPNFHGDVRRPGCRCCCRGRNRLRRPRLDGEIDESTAPPRGARTRSGFMQTATECAPRAQSTPTTAICGVSG
jgi:hypothetical protein